MRFSLRNALREIRNNRSFCLFYLVNLSLGLIGFMGVNSFKSSLALRIQSESRELLGADLAIRARREFSPQELESVRRVLPAGFQETKAVDFFSMVAGPSGRSRLIKVVAIGPGFPYYGKFESKLGGAIVGDAENLIHQRPLAWIYPELKSQLELEIGDEIKLGEASFRVTDYILEDSGLSFQAAELAPKAFVGLDFLDRTKLLAQGNLAFRNLLFKLPEHCNLQELANTLEKVLSNPEIRIYSHQRVGHRAGRLLGYLSDFLAIVSMVALFLACLGSGYLYQSFIHQRMKDIAILTCIGSSKSQAMRPYLIQLFLLGTGAVLPAALVCLLLVPVFSGTLSSFVPIRLEAQIDPFSVLLATLVAIFGGWLLALPTLWKIRRLRPSDLFRHSLELGTSSPSGVSFLFCIPGILAFWLLCLLLADSPKLAHLFFFSLLASVVVLYAIVRFFLGFLDRVFRKANLPLRLATRSLARNRLSTITGFLALGIGVLLLNLIPQFQYILENEIGSSDRATALPKLFLFDIQENQLDELSSLLAEEKKPIQNLTPWVRGKLLSVKGKKYERLAYEESEMRNPDEERRNNFRNRSFNLSYRDHLLESEEIVRGRMVRLDFDPNSSKPAEISVASKYAESLELDLGDRLVIEVGGVPIPSEVVNIRRVRWTSFQPNFFVQMQPGVLENAPKTYVATISDLNPLEKDRIQDLLVGRFPTISILDVERTGRKILEIVSQMTWALQSMALLSILAGIIVLYSLAREKARQQRWELNLLKILGASFSDLKALVRLEFGLLSLFASTFGVLLSVVTSYGLAVKVFDRAWSFHPTLPLLVVLGVCLLSLLVTEFAARKTLREKPGILLEER